ncbi:MAG: hypothetical protein SO016_12355 [Lachnospiraceae bacterium]|nr:hypothetical protein [Lachnospiraceae bacterium]
MQKKEERRELDYTAIGSISGAVIALCFVLGLLDAANASYFFWIAVGSGTILNGTLAGVSFSRRRKAAGSFFLFFAAVCLCLFLYQVISMMEGKQ